MTTSLDKKMLNSFTREARLPPSRSVRVSKHTYRYPQGEVLEEALRYVHTIKGAAAIVGLSALSHMTSYIEETFDDHHWARPAGRGVQCLVVLHL